MDLTGRPERSAPPGGAGRRSNGSSASPLRTPLRTWLEDSPPVGHGAATHRSCLIRRSALCARFFIVTTCMFGPSDPARYGAGGSRVEPVGRRGDLSLLGHVSGPQSGNAMRWGLVFARASDGSAARRANAQAAFGFNSRQLHHPSTLALSRCPYPRLSGRFLDFAIPDQIAQH